MSNKTKRRERKIAEADKSGKPAGAGQAWPAWRAPLFPEDAEPLGWLSASRPWRALGVVLLIALLARGAQFLFIWAYDPGFALLQKGNDAKAYDDWAMRIAGGDWLSRQAPVFYLGPLYAYFLAFIYKIFGHRYAVAHLVQFALGVLSCGAVFLAGTRWFSRRVALAAALGLALCPTLLFYEGLLLPESLTFFMLALFFLCLGLLQQRPGRWWLWGALGLCLGLAALQRANSLVCASGVLAWAIWGLPGWTRGRRAAGFGIFLTGLALAIAPATLHNRMIGGERVLVTSNGMINFYIGNGQGAMGVFAYTENFDKNKAEQERLDAERDGLANKLTAARQGGKSAEAADLEGQIARNREQARQVQWGPVLRREILAAPLDWLGLMFKKTYMFWGGYDQPDNYSFALYARHNPLLRFNPFSYSLLISLGFVGVALSLARWRSLLGLYFYLITFSLSITLVFISGRFRLPVLTGMSLFAGVAAWKGYEWGRDKYWARLVPAAAATAALMVLLNLYRCVPFAIRPQDFTMYARYWQEGNRPEQAIETLREGEEYYLAFHPAEDAVRSAQLGSLQLVRGNLARTLMVAEKWAEAEATLDRLVKDRLATADHVEMLILCYLRQKKIQQAEETLQVMQQREPTAERWRKMMNFIQMMKAGGEP